MLVCNCRQQRLEQERRDRELALRLAQEDQSQVEDLPGRSVNALYQFVFVFSSRLLFVILSFEEACGETEVGRCLLAP